MVSAKGSKAFNLIFLTQAIVVIILIRNHYPAQPLHPTGTMHPAASCSGAGGPSRTSWRSRQQTKAIDGEFWVS